MTQPQHQEPRQSLSQTPLASARISSLAHLEQDRDVKLCDIGGCECAKAELELLRDDILALRGGAHGIELPLGIMIHGQGSAKKLLVKALAAESESPLLYLNAGDLIGLETPLDAVTELFEDARDLAKSVSQHSQAAARNTKATVLLLIHDIGCLLPRDSDRAELHTADRKILQAIFRAMRDISRDKDRNLVVLATLSGHDISSLQLKNDTPFTHDIEVPLPDTVQCRTEILEKIFKRHLQPNGYLVSDNTALPILARLTHRMSGAELNSIMRLSAENARHSGHNDLTIADLVEAYLIQTLGRKRDRPLPEKVQEAGEFHEHGGHGIMSLASGVPCILISTQPRAHTGGQVIQDSSEFADHAPTKRQLLAQILLSVGGISAERFYFGDLEVSAGSGRDLVGAQRIAQRMLVSGLLGDHYNFHSSDNGEAALREPHATLINQLITNACITAEKILDAVGKDSLKAIVEAARTTGRDIIGPDAEQFYAEHLSADKKRKITRLAQTFFENPVAEQERPASRSRDTVL